MFLAILVVGFTSYSISHSALTTQISEEKLNTLTQTRNNADSILKEIEKTFIKESVNPRLLKFASAPFGEDHSQLKQTIKELVNIKNASKLIYSVYVYLPEQNLIITTEDGFWAIDAFYDVSWLDAMSQDHAGNWTTSRSLTTFWGETVNVATYITRVPFQEYMDKSSNLLIVNIYEKELLKLIEGHSVPDPGSSCIIDEEGRVVAHRDKALLGKQLDYDRSVMDQILGQKSTAFYFETPQGSFLASNVRSDYNRWNYLSIIPERQIIRPIVYLRLISIAVAIICIILGLIAAYIISTKIYKPISDTISSAKIYGAEVDAAIGEQDTKDEMAFLSATIKQIVEKNKNLTHTMQKNEGVMKERFIMDLLLSPSMDEIQLESKLSLFSISFPHKNYYILVILLDKFNTVARLYSDKERALMYLGIKNISEETLNDHANGILVQTEKDKFAALVNCSSPFSTVRSMADKIREKVQALMGFTVTIGISSDFNSLNETSLMYGEASDHARSRIVLGGNRVISDQDVSRSGTGIYSGSSLREDQIITYIRQGNVQEAIRHIQKAIYLIQKEPGYPQEEIHQFFYSILYGSIKAVNENGWSISDIFSGSCDLYRDLMEHDTLSDIFDWLCSILVRMSSFIAEKKESKNCSLIESILKYMHENYHKDISLNAMAEYVSLSTPYLSKLFKSETGENFLEYLTKIRIDKSKELLMDQSDKIAAIAEKVNFGNVQNFIRIFKKYEGMTPGQFREMKIKESLAQQDGKR